MLYGVVVIKTWPPVIDTLERQTVHVKTDVIPPSSSQIQFAVMPSMPSGLSAERTYTIPPVGNCISPFCSLKLLRKFGNVSKNFFNVACLKMLYVGAIITPVPCGNSPIFFPAQ